MDSISPASPPASWLIRISEIFAGFSTEIIEGLGASLGKKLGSEYYLIQLPDSAAIHSSEAAKYLRWNLPVDHAWPCNPEKMEGFVEKAAQAMFRKFGERNPQAIFIGQLDPSATNRYYKTLASNLRGRTLQLFPKKIAEFKEVEAQDSSQPTLFCLVGKEGLFCGMQSPKDANGFYPGGTKYISQNSPDTISRAGAKIAEALHYLRMFRPKVKSGTHWLELGACPGGMTSELLGRGYKVTALDRAPLDKRLDGQPGLHFALMDVAAFRPNANMTYGAILSDMNNDPRESFVQVVRLSKNLNPGGIVIFTLKTQGVTTYQEMNALYQFAIDTAAAARLRHITTTHLTYNRHELTLFFELPKADR
ncbi:MAG: SAM-dependent methyltransferase [Luteolibacter sp.]|uniref:SAM-dependent methyltransferase n=1 Tax=Luteolibacter sp. TaxID=1962973 RepID=UPI003266A9A3